MTRNDHYQPNRHPSRQTPPCLTPELLERALEHWARWCLRSGIHMGYPTESALHHRHAPGKTSAKKDTVLVDECAERIEALVLDLCTTALFLAKALRVHYVGVGPQRRKAALLQRSPAQFRVDVDMARYWLMGRLSAPSEWGLCRLLIETLQP